MNKQGAIEVTIHRTLRHLVCSAAFVCGIMTSASIADEQMPFDTTDGKNWETAEGIAYLEERGDRFADAIALIEELQDQPGWAWADQDMDVIFAGSE